MVLPKSQTRPRRHSTPEPISLENHLCRHSTPEPISHENDHRRHSTPEPISLENHLQNLINVSSISPRKLYHILNTSTIGSQGPERRENGMLGQSIYHDTFDYDIYEDSDDEADDDYCLDLGSSGLCNKQSKRKQKKLKDVESLFENDGNFQEVDGFYVYNDTPKSDTKRYLGLNLKRGFKSLWKRLEK